MHLSLLTGDNRNLQEDFNKSLLDFTWKVLEFTEKAMSIQLNFSNPLQISPNMQQDSIQIDFKDSLLSEDGRKLQEVYQVLSEHVPTQLDGS